MWLDTREGRSLLAQISWRPPISSIGLLEKLGYLGLKGSFRLVLRADTHTHTLGAGIGPTLCGHVFINFSKGMSFIPGTSLWNLATGPEFPADILAE